MKSFFLAVFAIVIVSAASFTRASTPSDPLFYDTRFAGGSMLDDRFAEPAAANTLPQKSALLSNADIVTVGIVPAANSTMGGNLGLVHYDPNGGRIGWPAPTPAYASYYNIYLTYPNTTTGAFERVSDVKVAFGSIYALVDYYGSDTNANIVAFTESGAFNGYYSGLVSSDNESGLALVPYQDGNNRWLLLVGNDRPPGNSEPFIVIKRFSVAANGKLTADPTYANGGSSNLSVPLCSCGLVGSGVKAVRTTSASPTLYIVGSVFDANETTQISGFTVIVDGASGLASSRNTGEANVVPAGVDVVAGASAAQDIVYSLDTNADNGVCENGNRMPFCAITKMFASSLQLDSSFGSAGEASIISPHYCTDSLSFKPESIAVSNNRIVVVGYDTTYFHNLGSSSYPDFEPMSATLRTSDGTQTSFNGMPALQTNGSAWGDAQFSDIVVADAGHFYVSGAIGFPPFMASHSAPYEFGTARLIADEIFPDGFDNP